MNHDDFEIGTEFWCGRKRWRCTDTGRRTVLAVCLSEHKDDPSWLTGPPYGVIEQVFDEYDLAGCMLEPDDEAGEIDVPARIVRTKMSDERGVFRMRSLPQEFLATMRTDGLPINDAMERFEVLADRVERQPKGQ